MNTVMKELRRVKDYISKLEAENEFYRLERLFYRKKLNRLRQKKRK